MSIRKGRTAKNQRRLNVARRLIINADKDKLVSDERTLANTIGNMRRDKFNFSNYPEFRRYL